MERVVILSLPVEAAVSAAILNICRRHACHHSIVLYCSESSIEKPDPELKVERVVLNAFEIGRASCRERV